ncbi:MAG: adenylate/guanylate cyclase domain-containing protein [Roseivirga sp.]
MIFGIVYNSIEQGVLGDATTYPSTGNPYFFSPLSSGLLALLAGLFLGSMEVLFLNKRFRKSGFLSKIIYKTMIYMLLIAIITLMISVLGHAIEMGISPLNQQVWDYGLKFLSSFAFWTVEIYMGMGISFCLFYTEISDNIGQGVLLNFFTGKYHKPIEEERIFMFLDMKDSTTIAEKLGHVKYFQMLSEYYADLTQAIIDFGGEIYQYVGDEVVVTWKQQKGIKNNNCLRCFFAMKDALHQQADKYESAYGLAPSFKAALHLGLVTTGEIGVIKKDIIFSGDVLNTTARIQSLCNQYEVDLLTSEQMLDVLKLEPAFKSHAMGQATLKGRNEKVRLFTIEKAN